MWGVVPTVALLTLAGELEGDARATAELVQQLGSIPSGTPPDAAGEIEDGTGRTLLAYDTVVRPGLALQLTDQRLTLRLSGNVRFLLRYQREELDGETWCVLHNELELRTGPDGAPVLPEGCNEAGLPFLTLGTASADAIYQVGPSWTWTNSLQGTYGEQDFALFVREGGAGGTGAGGVPESPVILTRTFQARSLMAGRVDARHDLEVAATLDIGLADPSLGGEMAETGGDPPGEMLCFGEPDERPMDTAVISDTCTLGLTFAGVRALSRLDELRLELAYSAIDIDPGPYVHTLRGGLGGRHGLSRSIDARWGVGGILVVSSTTAEGSNVVEVLPTARLGLGVSFIDVRRLRLSLDLGLVLDGFTDPVTQRYLLQGATQARLSAVIDGDWSVSLSVEALAIGLGLACPPLAPVALLEDESATGQDRQCPSEEELELDPDIIRDEQSDLTAVTAGITVDWTIDRNASLFAAGRYGRRFPHLSRLGNEVAERQLLAPEEASVQLGLRLAYGTSPEEPAL